MTKVAIWTAAAALVAVLSAADPAVTQARALAGAGRREAAERVLRDALAAGKDTAEIHGALGALLYDAGRFTEAVLELGRAAQLDPQSAEHSMKLAGAILAERRYSVALEFLKAVQTRFNGLAEYHYNVGLAYYGLHDWTNAAPAFRKALDLSPNMDLAIFFLGNVYASTSELEKAAAEYRNALALNPRNPGYCYALGRVLAQLGPENDDEAMRLFRTVLEVRPGDIPSMFALALACERRDDLACARPLLERVVAARPRELPPHVALARVYTRLELKDKAEAERRVVRELEEEARRRRAETRSEPVREP
jgi:tetratricopeptide (TPR) repeat protein